MCNENAHPLLGVMFVRCSACKLELPSLAVPAGDPADGMISHGYCEPCAAAFRAEAEAITPIPSPDPVGPLLKQFAAVEIVPCPHVWGPIEYGCTMDGHSTARQCTLCKVNDFDEDDSKSDECEQCASMWYACPGGPRSERPSRASQEFAERQRPVEGY